MLYIPYKYETSMSYNISHCAQDKAMKAAYPDRNDRKDALLPQLGN